MEHSHCRANWSSATRSSLHCTEPKGSLLHSQAPATCPYLKPDKFCPHLSIYLFKIHFNIILPSVPRFVKWFLCCRFPHQSHVHIFPLPHACQMPHHSHPPWLHHPITLHGKRRSQNSSWHNLLQYPLTPTPLCPHIFLELKQTYLKLFYFLCNNNDSRTAVVLYCNITPHI